MELSGVLVWAAVAISLIAFIVFLVKTFQNWGVWMTICFVLLFIECWTFMFVTAGVNKARLASTKAYDDASTENLKLIADREEAFFGDYFNPSPDMQKYVPLAAELNRVLLERGRTWRGAQLLDLNPSRAIVRLPSDISNTVPAVQDGPAAAAPRGNDSLGVDSVIYAFGEDENQVPRVYFGEFKVTTADQGEITLVPTAPLAPAQAQALNQSRSWAIYELMPLDSHHAFAQPGSASSDTEIFGNMDPKEISELLQIPLELAQLQINAAPDLATAIKARVLQSYLLDGKPAPEGTPLENLAYEVTFLKEYTEAVDSDNKRKATEGGYFDASGRAVDSRLMRTADAAEGKFNVDDTYLLYGPKAKQLETEGVVRLGRYYYVRPLNDYEYGFRDTRRLTQQTFQDIALVNREIEVISKSETNARQMLIKYEEIGRMLELDKGQYAKELEVIQSEKARITEAFSQKNEELRRVTADIWQLHSKLINWGTNSVPAIDSFTAK